MLVLNRQRRETITAILPDGRQMVIAVNDYSRSKGVTVGIDAPKDVRVFRTEVMDRPDFVLPTNPQQ